ncbi:MAG TPA: Eco29kI family restriction endonuclease [Thiobacillaceae bacterium]|nr:Eco29kI family restriction endonuclease [Thiobacillaceae bacterium]HNU65040.1 Eco29kI family restriction endonuclease [Thiobacillaceae bacterium]
MSADIVPFNPLDKRHLGESVANALLTRPIKPITELQPFVGAGVYAIYYTGEFPAYRVIAERNRGGVWSLPIYVGKAVPAGSRKGGAGLGDRPGQVLYKRLREHLESIEAVQNLDSQDFGCRYLTVDDIWIPLGESLLIARFSPIWNTLVDGFGNHDPGKGRHAGLRPRWDTLHPGRSWADKLQERDETPSSIQREIKEVLAALP